MEGALLVLLEVGGLNVVLIGLLRSVDFEDSKLSAILLHLIWEEAEHTRFFSETLLLNLCCSVEIGFEVFRIDLDFSNADEHRAVVACGCWLVRCQPQQPLGVLMEYHLLVGRKVWLISQILLHALETLGEHLCGNVGIVGTIEQMVGRGDGEQHADDLRAMSTSKIVIEGCEICLPIDIAHEFVGLHHGSQRLHARNHQRQIGSAMRHYHLNIIIASQHITANHIADGASGLGEILLHGEWCLLHHLFVDRVRTMRMQDDKSLALIKKRKKRVEFRCAQILTTYVCCQFDAVGTKYIQRIAGFLDGGIYIRQR